jgi:K+-sensing histidine kinase KdpD
VIRRTVALATPEHAKITVLGIARIFGTALGLPHPGLRPTKLEWDDQRTVVQDAAEELRRRGFDVLLASAMARNAPKLISRWVRAKNFHAVVIPDPERPAWRRRIEGELDREIGRRAHVPVHAVPVPAPSRPARR